MFRYGHAREYRLEIAAITVDWLVLIANGFMMAIIFRRELGAERTRSKLAAAPIPRA